jgi:hypothetical protein
LGFFLQIDESGPLFFWRTEIAVRIRNGNTPQAATLGNAQKASSAPRDPYLVPEAAGSSLANWRQRESSW